METHKNKKLFRKMWGCLVAVGEWLQQNIIGLIGAMTGLASLIWQLIDRRKGKPLCVSIQTLHNKEIIFTPEGYVPLEISFWNDNPFTIILTEVAVCNVKRGDVTVGMSVDETGSRYVLKQHSRPQTFTQVYKAIWPYVPQNMPIATGTKAFSDIFFVSYEALRTGRNILDFRLTYHDTNRKRRNRTVTIRGGVYKGLGKPNR